jgi:hypothetical protein
MSVSPLERRIIQGQLLRLRSRKAYAEAVCATRLSPARVQWQFCMVSLGVGIEAGGIYGRVGLVAAFVAAGLCRLGPRPGRRTNSWMAELSRIRTW